MKFSVLLPTRDRLDLLTHAIESVRRQDDDDWQIVVSDNNSEQDVGGYVAGLGDSRVRYVRTSESVPVTENWNSALRHSDGEYLIMLGDDDALLPGYFSGLRRVVDRFGSPDAVYTNAVLYAYPGVDPAEPAGYLQPYGYAPFLSRTRATEEPFALDPNEAHRLVVAAMDFRVRYGFNMQFALLSRRIVEQIAAGGDFFRSPFPDYYAMNMLFLKSRSIVVDPAPRVVIGMSPKSYGFFHVSGREEEAVGLLASVDDTGAEQRLKDTLLPGTNINTGWLLAMEAVRLDAGDASLKPNVRRYRMLQIIYVHQNHLLGDTISASQFADMTARMHRWERLVYGSVFRSARALRPLVPRRLRRAINYAFSLAQRQTPHWAPARIPGSYADISDVCERAPLNTVAASQA